MRDKKRANLANVRAMEILKKEYPKGHRDYEPTVETL
jgi:hypothetical protein